MKRLAPAPAVTLLLASCTHDPVRRAVPTPTPSTSSSSPSDPSAGTVPDGFAPSDATFVSARTGWVLGSAACPTSHQRCAWIARTHDGGATWRGLDLHEEQGGSLRFVNQRDGFLVAAGLEQTHDGGSTWQEIPLPGMKDVEKVEVAHGRVWIVGQDTADRVGVWRHALGSDRYDAATLTLPAGASDVAIALHGAAAFVTYADPRTYITRLLVASDGERFVPRHLPCTTDRSVGNLAVRTAQALLVVCGRGEGTAGQEPKDAWTSTDQGRSWRLLPEPAQLHMTFVAATSGAFFVANNRYVQRLTNTRLGWWGVFDVGDLDEINALGFEGTRLGFVIESGSKGPLMHLSHDDGRTWHTVDFRRTGSG